MPIPTIVTQELEALAKAAGAKGLEALKAQVATQGSAEVGWKKDVWAIVSDAVAVFGPKGMDKALGILTAIASGKTDYEAMPWADLEATSNLLARMQNAEAAKRAETHAYLVKVGEVAGSILKGALASVI